MQTPRQHGWPLQRQSQWPLPDQRPPRAMLGGSYKLSSSLLNRVVRTSRTRCFRRTTSSSTYQFESTCYLAPNPCLLETCECANTFRIPYALASSCSFRTSVRSPDYSNVSHCTLDSLCIPRRRRIRIDACSFARPFVLYWLDLHCVGTKSI